MVGHYVYAMRRYVAAGHGTRALSCGEWMAAVRLRTQKKVQACYI
jgi:hypothetical protein